MVKDILNQLDEKNKKTISVYREELQSYRAGRANAALLDGLTVKYYGTETPLIQLASISVPEARLLVIQPYDSNLIPEIEKEIQKSNLGITPSNDGKLIRLPFPALTEERRKELVKMVRKASENAKVAIRNSRRDAMDQVKRLEKEENLPEDDRKQAEQDVQKIIDKNIDEIIRITEDKEKDLMEI